MERVDSAQRMLSGELGGTVQASLVKRYYMDPFPVVAERSAYSIRVDGQVADPVDHAEGFGMRERRGTPDRIRCHGLDDHSAVWAGEVAPE